MAEVRCVRALAHLGTVLSDLTEYVARRAIPFGVTPNQKAPRAPPHNAPGSVHECTM